MEEKQEYVDITFLIDEGVNETRKADLTANLVQLDHGKIWRVQPRMIEMVGNEKQRTELEQMTHIRNRRIVFR